MGSETPEHFFSQPQSNKNNICHRTPLSSPAPTPTATVLSTTKTPRPENLHSDHPTTTPSKAATICPINPPTSTTQPTDPPNHPNTTNFLSRRQATTTITTCTTQTTTPPSTTLSTSLQFAFCRSKTRPRPLAPSNGSLRPGRGRRTTSPLRASCRRTCKTRKVQIISCPKSKEEAAALTSSCNSTKNLQGCP